MSTLSFSKINECDDWRKKLLGKVILEDNETSALAKDEFVRRKDLPLPNRVLSPNAVLTMDFLPNQYNIVVDHTMRVTGIQYGLLK